MITTPLELIKNFGDVITKPINVVCDTVGNWASEPLKEWEHKRTEQAKDNDVKRRIEVETAAIRTESEIKMKEAEQETDLDIKRKTEIHRITAEIEELQKDKQFERFKLATEAMMSYKERLSELNLNAINAIGKMDLSLRDKAHDLILDKTNKYKELQDRAFTEAAEKFLMIETKFADNEAAKNTLNRVVDKSLSNIVDNASKFIVELNEDIKMLTANIDSLTKSGQEFINNHLKQLDNIAQSGNQRQVIDVEFTEINNKKLTN